MGVENTAALNPEDVKIESLSINWPDHTIRITHIRTGISVEAIGFNEYELRESLLEKLRISIPKNVTVPTLPRGRR